MAKVLISFLGSSRYFPTKYKISDRVELGESRFFPHALIRHFASASSNRPFEQLVVCGTRTSSWRGLLDLIDNPAAMPKDPGRDEPAPITDEDLRGIEAGLRERLGIDVKTRIIGFAKTTAEQIAFVDTITSSVNRGDDVQFDITHGMRHLPMLAFTAALALRTLHGVQVSALWYGAFEMERDPNPRPVVRLDGLLQLVDWLTALSVFDLTSDVGHLAAPIDRESESGVGKVLREASFSERVSHSSSARATTLTALEALDDIDDEEGVARLVKPAIIDRLDWATKANRDSAAYELALDLASKGNEVRAITIAFETTVDRVLVAAQGGRTPEGELDKRDDFLSKFIEDAARQTGTTEGRTFEKNFRKLRHLRNTVVHLKKPINETKTQLASVEDFKKEFDRLLRGLSQPLPKGIGVELARIAREKQSSEKRR